MENKRKFRNYCEQSTKVLNKLLRIDSSLYRENLDFIINNYIELGLSQGNKGLIENSTIVSFYNEAIDTFDGIGNLHKAGCIRSAYPLVRKLLELYLQLKFLLDSDTANKALAYEAYYESRSLKGKNDNRSIYHHYAKYKIYKAEADKAFSQDQKPKFEEWYEIYDRIENENPKQTQDILRNLKKVAQKTGKFTDELYNKYYSILSKSAHGMLARDFIRYDSKLNINYIEKFRHPAGIVFQTILANFMMVDFYYSVCNYYSFEIDKIFLSNQEQKIKQVKQAYQNYLAWGDNT